MKYKEAIYHAVDGSGRRTYNARWSRWCGHVVPACVRTLLLGLFATATMA